MTERERTYSHTFEVDETQASGILAKTLHENNVFLSGSSVGKGLLTSAKYYIEKENTEDSFYVVDIGMVVSQVYQWRKFFPRVEPFYAVKCNPDPVIVKTLALMGTNFDCASRGEIEFVNSVCAGLPRKPEIIYANPCKATSHLKYALSQGVRMVTFDNASEVAKCAKVSKEIQLILRIATDDRGSQCRLSSKFGAPEYQWRPLLQAAKHHGLAVIGVSFHVGSGCRDASRYELALKDVRKIFDMGKLDFGFDMNVLDIGGGFPGETHSMWNPETLDNAEGDEDSREGVKSDDESSDDDEEGEHFMFFQEIATKVAPIIDELFPVDSGVRIIGEPGRYFVAACATLCCNVISVRTNQVDAAFEPTAIRDQETAMALNDMSRVEAKELVHRRTLSNKGHSQRGGSFAADDLVLGTIAEELADYSKLFARQNLAQQEADTYNDALDLFTEGFSTSADLLGRPEEHQTEQFHTVEGMTYPLVMSPTEDEGDAENSAFITLASAGEAAVSGVVMQAVADSCPLQDDFSVYVNDGVYGAFNCIMFDHANVRPRVLRMDDDVPGEEKKGNEERALYPTTVFGPTCDSIDVLARGVLLRKLKVNDWLYFNNMGAYTMAASSTFNGFEPSDKFYVCSIPPEYMEALIAGPNDPDAPQKDC